MAAPTHLSYTPYPTLPGEIYHERLKRGRIS